MSPRSKAREACRTSARSLSPAIVRAGLRAVACRMDPETCALAALGTRDCEARRVWLKPAYVFSLAGFDRLARIERNRQAALAKVWRWNLPMNITAST